MVDGSEFRIAYVHVLPLEYYPPATNTLSILAQQPRWNIRAWTSRNNRGVAPWSDDKVQVRRPFHGTHERPLLQRIAGYASWHTRTAIELARWKPHAVIAVEPHSMPAVWLYYKTLRGNAPLFIHHHEYYAPEDFNRPGMRLLAAGRSIEQDTLLKRAEWVSQTNITRMQMMLKTHPAMRSATAHVLPNYPPASWISKVEGPAQAAIPARTRLVYIGSASFEDTFIREAAEWVAAHPDEVELHVAGNNVADDVWAWLNKRGAPNITTDSDGVDYCDLPGLLARFDAGLVLYKGSTLNFVHNVPNKAIEYLACGLEVWYPPEMKEMRRFRDDNPSLRVREVDFMRLSAMTLPRVTRVPVTAFPFTAESALTSLLSRLEGVETASE